MDRIRSPHARTRFHAVIARHLRTGGLLNYGEFIRLARVAGVKVVSSRGGFQTDTKCQRCGRPIGVAYEYGGNLYGASCVEVIRGEA